MLPYRVSPVHHCGTKATSKKRVPRGHSAGGLSRRPSFLLRIRFNLCAQTSSTLFLINITNAPHTTLGVNLICQKNFVSLSVQAACPAVTHFNTQYKHVGMDIEWMLEPRSSYFPLWLCEWVFIVQLCAAGPVKLIILCAWVPATENEVSWKKWKVKLWIM